MIYDEYIEYTHQYKLIYPRALVLMEVGKFWEMYNCDNNLGAQIQTICDLCNLQYSHKDKKASLSIKNPLMAGFPSFSLDKYLPMLVADGYTVVLVSQVTPAPNPRREVTDIISGSTYFPNDTRINHDPYLVSLYFETIVDRRNNKKILTIGVVILEISTGVSRVAQCVGDYSLAHDGLYQLLSGIAPVEVVVYSMDDINLRELESKLELNCTVHDRCGLKFNKILLGVKYQNDTLKRVFSCNTILSSLEELDMERMPATACALVGAICFIEQHNTNLLKHMKRPIFMNNNTDMCELCFNTSKQLSVYSRDCKEKTLETILNRCVTSMGRRFFIRRLLSPYTCKRDIDASLVSIDLYFNDTDQLHKIRSALRHVCDLERLFHRIELGKCQWTSILMIVESLHVLQDDVCITSKLYEFMIKTFDVSSDVAFSQGVYEDVDQLHSQMNVLFDKMYGYVDMMNKLSGEGYFKLEHNERDGHYIVGTAKRWQMLKGVDEFKAAPISASSSLVKLTHVKLKEISDEYTLIKDKLSCLMKDRWNTLQAQITNDFYDEFTRLVRVTSELDFYTTCALNAKEFGYSRPFIVDDSNALSSYIKCKGMRHPILERIHDQVKYVDNDFEIGHGTQQDGILLYGLNSVGKSSLMKAVGLCTIMAQSGMYVACSEYESIPYTRIFTRITRGDDMLKGHSTFTVEMTELRNILKRSDCRSLVVGDELCAGTESISGTSIVAAGVLQLLSRNTSFVLTTHLHNLIELDILKTKVRLGVYHLAVHYDDIHGSLVYDRKLSAGGGSSVYGLEVCRSLDMDSEFMSLADEIRLSIQKPVLKTSRYNTSVVVDTCRVCGAYGQEVHHIVPQVLADSMGMITNFHKNATHNLVCLCKTCHDQVHAGILDIGGYHNTSKGVKLRVTKNTKPQTQHIQELINAKRASGMSYQNILNHINVTCGIKMSMYMIKKISLHNM